MDQCATLAADLYAERPLWNILDYPTATYGPAPSLRGSYITGLFEVEIPNPSQDFLTFRDAAPGGDADTIKTALESMWAEYEPYADGNFRTAFAADVDPGFWEVYCLRGRSGWAQLTDVPIVATAWTAIRKLVEICAKRAQSWSSASTLQRRRDNYV